MNNETQMLAAKLLAQILAGDNNQTKNGGDAAKILARLDEMNSRLVKIESRINQSNPQTPETEFLSERSPVFAHSSQERFAIENDAENEKTCRFEPGGKPCDYCAMCSSRGF